MAIDVTIRARFPVPGGGFNSAGQAVNNKEVVVGQIDITTYTADGEPVTPRDLGLTTIDAIHLDVERVDGTAAGNHPTATNIFLANYDYLAEQVLVWDGASAATVAGSSARVRFTATGDSAHVANLT